MLDKLKDLERKYEELTSKLSEAASSGRQN